MPRETLSRDRIVEAAVEVLDAEGVGGLNMRRLGARLGVVQTAMYHYVRDKDELVTLAADSMWKEVCLPDPSEVPWQAAAAELARQVHSMLGRHPWLLVAMSTHLIYGPGKARFDECCLTVFEDAGFAGSEADQAAATLLIYVVGAAQGEAAEHEWRARLRRDGVDDQQRIRTVFADMTAIAQHFPRLRTRLTAEPGEMSTLPDLASFEFGLRVVLDGLRVRLAGRDGQAK